MRFVMTKKAGPLRIPQDVICALDKRSVGRSTGFVLRISCRNGWRIMKDIIFKGAGTAIVIAGTTGQGSTLTDEEHIDLVRQAVKFVNGRGPVIAGAGDWRQGVISLLANIVPEDTHRICSSYFEGNSEESDNLQLKYLELIEALFLDVNPIPIKQAMRAMGYKVGHCRLPTM